MIKIENISIWGFESAIRGMRNPMNSWDKSDSGYCFDFDKKYEDGTMGCSHDCPKWSEDNYCGHCEQIKKYQYDGYIIGKNDLDLMRRLYNAGTEHRKYLRQIFVNMDIVAPLYWWKEFDQYKIGVVTNSCSTMHKIHAKEFVADDFSCEHLGREEIIWLENTIALLNKNRESFIALKDKSWWWQMIEMLPTSYNQRRTVTMNYENVMSMIHQRTGHKLDEWNQLVDIFNKFPYIKEIMETKNNDAQ